MTTLAKSSSLHLRYTKENYWISHWFLIKTFSGYTVCSKCCPEFCPQGTIRPRHDSFTLIKVHFGVVAFIHHGCLSRQMHEIFPRTSRTSHWQSILPPFGHQRTGLQTAFLHSSAHFPSVNRSAQFDSPCKLCLFLLLKPQRDKRSVLASSDKPSIGGCSSKVGATFCMLGKIEKVPWTTKKSNKHQVPRQCYAS